MLNLSKKCVGKSSRRGRGESRGIKEGAAEIAGGAIYSTVQCTIFTLLGAFAVDKKFSSFHFFLYIVLGEWKWGMRKKKSARDAGQREGRIAFYCAPQRVYPRVYRGMVISFRSSPATATATGTLERAVPGCAGLRCVKPLATNTNC